MPFLKNKLTIGVAVVLLAILIGSFGYAAYQQQSASQSVNARLQEFQKTLTWVQTVNPRVIGYPRFSGDNNQIVLTETYESLVRFQGNSYDLKPGAAERWEVSSDGAAITFFLRKGLKFYPSGDSLNATAVKYSIDDAFSGAPYSKSNVGNYGSSDQLQYDRTEIVDQYTVKTYFKKSLAWMPVMFAWPQIGGIMNPNFINAHGGIPKTAEGLDPYLIWHQDVSGPYIVDQFVQNDRIVLKRNPTYWMGWTGNMSARPEQVIVRIVPEAATRLLLIGRGDADLADVEIQYLPELKSRIKSENLPLAIDETPSLRQLWIVLDNLHPPTNDVHIRKMLAYSFNYDQYIQKVMFGFGDRLTTYVPKGMWGYDANSPHYDFDMAKAQQELSLASPENRTIVQNGIKVRYQAGYSVGREGFLMWKSDLAKIGVNLVLDEASYSSYWDSRRAGNVPILDGGWNPDFPDPATFYAWVNGGFYISKAFGTTPNFVSDLLNKATIGANRDQRLQIYRQVEQWAYDNVPHIKVASGVGGGRYNVRGTWVKGYQSNIFDGYRPLFIEVWKELPQTGLNPTQIILPSRAQASKPDAYII